MFIVNRFKRDAHFTQNKTKKIFLFSLFFPHLLDVKIKLKIWFSLFRIDYVSSFISSFVCLFIRYVPSFVRSFVMFLRSFVWEWVRGWIFEWAHNSDERGWKYSIWKRKKEKEKHENNLNSKAGMEEGFISYSCVKIIGLFSLFEAIVRSCSILSQPTF